MSPTEPPGRGAALCVGAPGAGIVLAGILVLIAVLGAPALRAPASARAERTILVEDRVIDGAAPMSAAWTHARGPLQARPLARLVLRGEDVIWDGNPAGFRFAGLLLLALAGVALTSALCTVHRGPVISWLGPLILLTSPAAIAVALWFPARGDVASLALGLISALIALHAHRLDAAGHDGGTELVLATLVGIVAAALGPAGLLAPITMLGLVLVTRRRWRSFIAALSILLAAAASAHAAGGSLVEIETPGVLLDRLLSRLGSLTPGAQGLAVEGGGPRGWITLGVVAGLATLAILERGASRARRGAVAAATLLTLLLVATAPAVASRAGSAAEALPALALAAALGAILAGRRSWMAFALVLLAAWSAFDSFQLARRLCRPVEVFERVVRVAPEAEEANTLLARQRVIDGDPAAAVKGLVDAIDASAEPSRRLRLEAARLDADLAGELASVGSRLTADGLLADGAAQLAALAPAATRDERIDSALIGARLALLAEPSELRRALELLTQADSLMLAADRRQEDRLLLLGHVRSAYANDDAAGQAYRQALAEDPSSFEVCYHLGNFLVSRADGRERAEDLESAARYRQEAILLLERAWRSRALDQGGTLGRLLVVQLGGNYGKVGMAQESRAILEEGLSRWPDEPRILFNHALTLIGTPSTLVRGETEMMRALEQARQQGQVEAPYFESILGDHLVRRGNGLIESGDVVEAERLAVLAVEVSPTNFSAQILLGDVRFAEARFDEAMKAYAQALSLGTDSIAAQVKYYHAMRQRGMVALLRMSGLKVQSRKDPDRAAELCAEFQRVKAMAISDLRQFLENLPGDEKVEGTRRRLEALEGAECVDEVPRKPPPLEDETAMLIRRQLASARERFEEGMVAFAAEDHELAARSFQRAISLFSREPRFHLMRARALAELPGQLGVALFSAERALALDAKVETPVILFHAGELAVRVAALPVLPEQVESLFPEAESEDARRQALRARARDRLNMFIQLAPASEVTVERARGLLLDLRDR